MSKSSLAGVGLSRRRIIKATVALAAGIAAAGLLQPRGVRRLSGARGQDRGGELAGWTLRHHRPLHGGRAAVDRHLHRGEQGRRRRQYRTASVARSLHQPCGQSRLYASLPYDPFKDFAAISGARHLAQRVHGQVGARRRHDEGVRRARQGQPGEVQRLDAADRHHAAARGRGAQGARRVGPDGHHRVRRRRRGAAGGARRHGATELPARSRRHSRRSRPAPSRDWR